MSAYLDIGGPDRVLQLPVITKIGSLASAHVHLEGEDVSRMHAVIEAIHDGYRLVDLGSTAGTWINDKKVGTAPLHDGDVIRVGRHYLRFRRPQPGANLQHPPGKRSARDPIRERAEAGRASHECPHCSGPLDERLWNSGGGYRDGATKRFWRCDRCRLSVTASEVLQARYGRKEPRLGGSMLERDRRPSGLDCPHCPGQLEHLTLAWDAAWVEIEECPRCGVVVMDDGEGKLLDRLLGDTSKR